MNNNSTIVACSTGNIRAGIAIIRLSGKESLNIAKKLTKLTKEFSRKLEFCKFYTDTVIDNGLISYFEAPNSFTGEDMVEINCHGNPIIVDEIIKHCIRNGARIAENGEFSKWAYFNGKLDLIQAESIVDIINSESIEMINNSEAVLDGNSSKVISVLQNKILEVIGKIEVALDYPEEGIEESTAASVKAKLIDIIEEMDNIIESYNNNRVIRDGIKVAIIGSTNVGKSQLLNALLGLDRAIVTDIEGTTRDTLEESYLYKGRKFVVTDTAGIRDAYDVVEKLGIARSIKAMNECDIIVALDTSDILFDVKIPKDKNIIFVRNKVDIIGSEDKQKINISAKFGTNVDVLKEKIYKSTDCVNSPAIVNNTRQLSHVLQAKNSLSEAIDNIGKYPLDCIAIDIRSAWESIGNITGVTTSDTIVGEIFSKFCVGK